MQPNQPDLIDLVLEVIARIIFAGFAFGISFVVWEVFCIEAKYAPEGSAFSIYYFMMVLAVLSVSMPAIFAPFTPSWTTATDYLHGPFNDRVWRRLIEYMGLGLFMSYLAYVPGSPIYGLIGLAWCFGYWYVVIHNHLIDEAGLSGMSTSGMLFITAILAHHWGWHNPVMWPRLIVVSILIGLVSILPAKATLSSWLEFD